MGGMKEIVKNQAGLLTDRTPQGVAEAIQKLLYQDNRCDISLNARNLAESFDNSLVTTKWLHLYAEILAKKEKSLSLFPCLHSITNSSFCEQEVKADSNNISPKINFFIKTSLS